MAAFWKKYGWIAATVVGSALFALGFSLFLAPNEINTGGLSGLAQIAVHVLGVGSVGLFTVVFNLPLFIAGGIRIGKRFFAGSLHNAEVSAWYPRVPSGQPIREPWDCRNRNDSSA